MADEIKVDSKEFTEFYKVLSKVDPELKKAIRKRLIAFAKPVVEEVKQAERSISSNRQAGQSRKKKGESLGLRNSLAAATKADFNGTGRGGVVHIRVSSSRFITVSGRPRTLPYYMEGRRKRDWRHPVFGNKEVWVKQTPHPYLYNTVYTHKDSFEKAVGQAVEEALQVIDNKVD